MKVDIPNSVSPITPNADRLEYNVPSTKQSNTKSDRTKFIGNISKLFGFQKKASKDGRSNIQFVKVDPDSNMSVAQSKIGKIMNTKMGSRLEEYFNSWLNETTDTIGTLQDRFKRISELEFAINNDPFLGMSVDLMADEATQLDQQDKLIMIDCANLRMKQRMEELLNQWSVTQSRVRSAMYNLAGYGDAFWSNKVTKNGVVRINPIDVRQILDRLEFNPVRVASDISLKQGFLSALSRDNRLQMLMDALEDEAQEEFADLFDSKLFGFVVANDLVVPPWNITHFRLSHEQSDFAPFGKPFLLKALAPFRQANATMTLQSLARIMNFPVTTYEVATTPGMDSAQQFERVNDAREQYENIGVTGNNSETYSTNTKMWLPKGLVELKVLSPNIDLNAIGDLELYQDRVVVASGVPKGYLVPDWGGFGVSGISLTEQFKPFARKVFTLQSAFLEGLTNLFRLHFAITGEFDYFEPFVLSMKFPNSEVSNDRINAKQASLDLSKSVIDTVADVIGSLNDPLPPEIVQDILTKFSFLDPEDIKKWIRVRTTKSQGENTPDESGMGGGSFGGGSSGGSSGGDDFGGGGIDDTSEDEDIEGSPDASEIDDAQFDVGDMGDMEGGENVSEGDIDSAQFDTEEIDTSEPEAPPQKTPNNESYEAFTKKRLSEARVIELTKRFNKATPIIYNKIIKDFGRFDEIVSNKRHYKYSAPDYSSETMLKVLKNLHDGATPSRSRSLKETIEGMRNVGFKIEESVIQEKEEQPEISLKDTIAGFMSNSEEENVSQN